MDTDEPKIIIETYIIKSVTQDTEKYKINFEDLIHKQMTQRCDYDISLQFI